MATIFLLALLASPLGSFGALLKPSDLPTTPALANKVLHYATGEFANALQKINPFLTAADLRNVSSGAACADRLPWETCNQYLSLFSGMAVAEASDKGYTFVGLTDRGPNVDCADFEDGAADEGPDSEWQWALDNVVLPESLENGQAFPAPKFAPSFFKVQMDTTSKKISLGQSCFLKNSKLQPINGKPNVAGKDPAGYGPTCGSGPLPYSQAGIDSEDIQIVPGRDAVIIVEEYTPSIVVARSFGSGNKCGEIIGRYVPVDSTLTTASAGYPIIKVLPKLFSLRRENRGMENLAISADGKTLIAMLQSPLGEDDATETSPVTPAVRLDISDLAAPKVLGVHLYLESPAANSGLPSTWADEEEEQKDIKLSGFADAAPVLGLKAGTPVVAAIERAKKQVKVFLVDFSKSTNVLPLYKGDFLKFDKLGNYVETKKALAAMGVVTAKKGTLIDTKLIDDGSATVEGWQSNDKQEGIAILNKCVVSLGNDNDFGYDADQSNMSIIQLRRCLPAVYKGMQQA